MQTFVTNDLSFAAYLLMHKVPILKAQKFGKTFKFVFEKTAEVERLRMSYPTSESSYHDDSIRKLKKLVFGDGFRD